jgi:hypothetical protein
LGLYRTEGIVALLGYIFPEFMVLVFVWSQQFYEIMVGLHEEREIQVEDISQARERFLGQFSQQAKKIMKDTVNIVRNPTLIKNLSSKADTEPNQVPDEEPGKDGLTYEQRSKFYIDELKSLKTLQRSGVPIAGGKTRKTGLEDYSAFKAKDGLRLEMEEFVAAKEALLPQTHSLIINPEARKAEVTKIKDKNMTRAQRLVKYMNSKTYFKNLFPLVKEQKPGKDFYARITFWQFIICLYLINYYTDLDARGTQNLENTNQFSFNMVIMLFIQVAVMIIERYIARTNTRVSRRGEDV